MATLLEKINSNTASVKNGKQNLKNEILAKGGTVEQAGDYPTFTELSNGVTTISTGANITGAEEITAEAIDEIIKGDTLNFYTSTTDFSLSLVGNLPTTYVANSGATGNLVWSDITTSSSFSVSGTSSSYQAMPFLSNESEFLLAKATGTYDYVPFKLINGEYIQYTNSSNNVITLTSNTAESFNPMYNNNCFYYNKDRSLFIVPDLTYNDTTSFNMNLLVYTLDDDSHTFEYKETATKTINISDVSSRSTIASTTIVLSSISIIEQNVFFDVLFYYGASNRTTTKEIALSFDISLAGSITDMLYSVSYWPSSSYIINGDLMIVYNMYSQTKGFTVFNIDSNKRIITQNSIVYSQDSSAGSNYSPIYCSQSYNYLFTLVSNNIVVYNGNFYQHSTFDVTHVDTSTIFDIEPYSTYGNIYRITAFRTSPYILFRVQIDDVYKDLVYKYDDVQGMFIFKGIVQDTMTSLALTSNFPITIVQNTQNCTTDKIMLTNGSSTYGIYNFESKTPLADYTMTKANNVIDSSSGNFYGVGYASENVEEGGVGKAIITHFAE